MAVNFLDFAPQRRAGQEIPQQEQRLQLPLLLTAHHSCRRLPAIFMPPCSEAREKKSQQLVDAPAAAAPAPAPDAAAPPPLCRCCLPPATCHLPQKHEEEQRLLDLQRQLQELEQQEQQLTAEAEELGIDAAQVCLRWWRWWRRQQAWCCCCGRCGLPPLL